MSFVRFVSKYVLFFSTLVNGFFFHSIGIFPIVAAPYTDFLKVFFNNEEVLNFVICLFFASFN